MSKPYEHAIKSAARHGGIPEDYIRIHNEFDISKSAHADMRHRALYHHSLGPFQMEKIFGITITNSDGKKISTRQIAEEHILDDLGFIPNFSDYLNHMEFIPWMAGTRAKKVPKSLLVD